MPRDTMPEARRDSIAPFVVALTVEFRALRGIGCNVSGGGLPEPRGVIGGRSYKRQREEGRA
jgi:hypothetical protein